MPTLDRRTVLQGGAAALAATGLGVTAANAAVVMRRSVNNMALNDPVLVSYRKAVAAMKGLPANDPRNWTKQAQIHNNFCPHGNWYFLPWHRAYCVAFERLCRQLSGDANFALPYWDWTANPQLPAAFATPTYNGQPNPLYDANRSSQTVTIPSIYVGQAKMTQIYAETSFEVFGSSRPNGQNNTNPSWQRAGGVKGPFESGPHDHTHTTIAGDMQTLMSPLDPIFWLHHCNIDRVWDHWNNMGRANTSDNLWRSFAFSGQFVNPSGANGTTPYNTTVSGVLDIVALGYRYTLPLFQVASPLLVAKFINPGDPVERIPLGDIAAAKINVATMATAKPGAPQVHALNTLTTAFMRLDTAGATGANPVKEPGRVMLFLRDVDPPMSGNADVRVFINHPAPTADTSTQDRHFAGAFTFFGTDHADHGGKPSFMLDITEVVKNLNLSGVDLANEIQVQLVPVPIPGVPAADQIKVGRMDVALF